jgi:hypothetical protein
MGIGDELRLHRCMHRLANHAAGERIGNGGNTEQAFRGPDIGEVGDPFAVGSGCLEAAVQHIGSDGGNLPPT